MIAAPTSPEAEIRFGSSCAFLLRALRASLDLRKALLAAAGLIVLQAGWGALDGLVPGTEPGSAGGIVEPRNVASGVIGGDRLSWEQVRSAGWRLTEPWRVLATPLLRLFGPGEGAVGRVRALLAVVWAVMVWGIFGGAIARLAVFEAGGAPGPGIVVAVRFAVRFALPLIAAPLCPLAAIGVCAVPCAGVGTLDWLPAGIGPALGGILLFIPLALGLIMAILLAGLLAGWPLMHASVAAEADDTLDALSRTFSYFNRRLGKAAGWLGLAWLIGIPGLIGVDWLASTVIRLTAWGLSLSAPASRIGLLDEAGLGISTGSPFSTFWTGVVALMARGWIYGYFWTAAAFVYLLLRRDVDGTPWSQVADGSTAKPSELPHARSEPGP